MSQAVLARALDTDQGTISRYERSAMEPSLDTIAAIEDACDRPRGFILRLAGYVDDSEGVLDSLSNDPVLSDDQREILAATYRAAVDRAAGRK